MLIFLPQIRCLGVGRALGSPLSYHLYFLPRWHLFYLTLERLMWSAFPLITEVSKKRDLATEPSEISESRFLTLF